MKIWGKSHPESVPRDFCPGWVVSDSCAPGKRPSGSLCWKSIRLTMRGPVLRTVLLGQFVFTVWRGALHLAWTPSKGPARAPTWTTLALENRKWGRRRGSSIQPAAQHVDTMCILSGDLGGLLHSALRPNRAQHETGIKALWGQWSTSKSRVLLGQFALLSGNLSRASQDEKHFPYQETALQSETPSRLSLSFLALFIWQLLCHWNKTFLLIAALGKAHYLHGH